MKAGSLLTFALCSAAALAAPDHVLEKYRARRALLDEDTYASLYQANYDVGAHYCGGFNETKITMSCRNGTLEYLPTYDQDAWQCDAVDNSTHQCTATLNEYQESMETTLTLAWQAAFACFGKEAASLQGSVDVTSSNLTCNLDGQAVGAGHAVGLKAYDFANSFFERISFSCASGMFIVDTFATARCFESTTCSEGNSTCTTAIGPLTLGTGDLPGGHVDTPLSRDFCSVAVPITNNTATGTLETAVLNAQVLGCDNYENFQPFRDGQWFSVVGDGDVFILNACGIETSLLRPAQSLSVQVYNGNCDSKTLGCIADFAAENTYSSCQNGGSLAVWPTDPGVEYYILVQGDSWGPESGALELNITTTEPPSNDRCVDAIPIREGTTNVSTAFASSESVSECSSSFFNYNNVVGVWYSFQGTGDIVEARICVGSFFVHSPFLSVSTGEDCGNSTCFATGELIGAEEGCEGEGAVVRWKSELGTTYQLLVETSRIILGDRDPLELTIELIEPAPNDLCEGAIEIFANSTTNVTSLAISTSDVDAIPVECLFERAPGVWYKFNGTGDTMVSSFCADDRFWYAGFSVLTGACGNLTCLDSVVDYEVDGCTGSGYSYTWASEPGTLYFLHLLAQGPTSVLEDDFLYLSINSVD